MAAIQQTSGSAVEHFRLGLALAVGSAVAFGSSGPFAKSLMTAGWSPTGLTIAGVALAVLGIMLVLDVFSGAHINLVGVGWGLAAAVCAACYFLMSANVAHGSGGSGGDAAIHPIPLAAGGLIVGSAAVTLLGTTGVMPLTFTTNDAVVAGWTTSWLVPVVALGVVATAVAYTLGIMGIAPLRPRFASLVGLSEVMFAVLAAWVLLGEALAPTQVLGAAIVLVGLALARAGDRSEAVVEATWPDGPPEGTRPAAANR